MFQITEAQCLELEQAEQSVGKVAELRRMQAVRLYGSGVRLTVIQQVVQASPRTVQRWVERYQAGGIGGLRERWQGGNNRKLTLEQRGEIRERLHQYRPVDVHLSQGMYWTVDDLKVAVEAWFGVVYRDDDSYHDLLHQCGFSYQRSTKVYRSKPSAAVVAEFEDELQKK